VNVIPGGPFLLCGSGWDSSFTYSVFVLEAPMCVSFDNRVVSGRYDQMPVKGDVCTKVCRGFSVWATCDI